MTSAAGKPKKPSTPSVSKPKRSKLNKAAKVEKAEAMQTMKWEKMARHAPWVAGQSMGINPGDPKAVSRLRHSKKFKARKKKVVRPRIRKQYTRNQESK